MSHSIHSFLQAGRLLIKAEGDGVFLKRRLGRVGPGLLLPRVDHAAVRSALLYWAERRSQWASFHEELSGVLCSRLVVQLPGRERLVIGRRLLDRRQGESFIGRELVRSFELPERIGHATLTGELYRAGERHGDADGEKVGELLVAGSTTLQLRHRSALLERDDGKVWMETGDLR